jgi:hypothetical protein
VPIGPAEFLTAELAADGLEIELPAERVMACLC